MTESISCCTAGTSCCIKEATLNCEEYSPTKAVTPETDEHVTLPQLSIVPAQVETFSEPSTTTVENLRQTVKDFTKDACEGMSCEWVTGPDIVDVVVNEVSHDALVRLDKDCKVLSVHSQTSKVPLVECIQLSRIISVETHSTNLPPIHRTSGILQFSNSRLVWILYEADETSAKTQCVVLRLATQENYQRFLVCMDILLHYSHIVSQDGLARHQGLSSESSRSNKGEDEDGVTWN